MVTCPPWESIQSQLMSKGKLLYGRCVAGFLFMHRYQLAASLVQCLKAVANTYHQAILETTFPDALFTSLVQLFVIKNPSEIVTKFTSCAQLLHATGVQLDVMVLWHQLIDHHSNRDKLPMDT